MTRNISDGSRDDYQHDVQGVRACVGRLGHHFRLGFVVDRRSGGPRNEPVPALHNYVQT